MTWWSDQHQKTPAPQLVSEDKRVRLYDAYGRVLVRDNTIGFRKPETQAGKDRRRIQPEGEDTRTEGRVAVEPPGGQTP
jgi:hypothetical protein